MYILFSGGHGTFAKKDRVPAIRLGSITLLFFFFSFVQAGLEFLIFLLFKKIFLLFYYVCVCVYSCTRVYPHMWEYPQKPEEGIRCPGAGVAGGYKTA